MRDRKKDIKQLIATALAEDESGTYKKGMQVQKWSPEDHKQRAYALQVRTMRGSGDDRKVLVYLSKGETVEKAKMKIQAEMCRSSLEKIDRARRGATKAASSTSSTSSKKNRNQSTHSSITDKSVAQPLSTSPRAANP